jgi:hypothetical protein
VPEIAGSESQKGGVRRVGSESSARVIKRVGSESSARVLFKRVGSEPCSYRARPADGERCA